MKKKPLFIMLIIVMTIVIILFGINFYINMHQMAKGVLHDTNKNNYYDTLESPEIISIEELDSLILDTIHNKN